MGEKKKKNGDTRIRTSDRKIMLYETHSDLELYHCTTIVVVYLDVKQQCYL